MTKLYEGKVSHSLLTKITQMKGYHYSSIIHGPFPGFDVGALNLAEAVVDIQQFYGSNSTPYLTYKSDPITFPTSNPAQYLIMVNQNDLATAGSRAYAMTVTILMPLGSEENQILDIQRDLDETAKREGIAILGGHSEVTSSVNKGVLSGSFIGFVPPEYYIGKDAREGDKIICSGWIGAEGTGIILGEGKDKLNNSLTKQEILDGINIGAEISISKRILDCNKRFHEGITMIHDITEGGFLAAIYESLEPLGLGAKIHGKRLPIASVTEKIAEIMDVNPLRLIGSGAVLVYSKPEYAKNIVEMLKTFDKPAEIVGEVIEGSKIFLYGDILSPPESDSIIKALQKLETLDERA